MILIDNTQILLASIFAQIRGDDSLIDEDFVRHMTLNTYRMYKRKYEDQYGELVICQDAGNYWRKDVFENYKQNRKDSQKKDSKDWNKIFGVLTKIRDEVSEVFPYKHMYVARCEADDIIATLVKHNHEKEKIMIVSADKDFQQLHKYKNVKQYSPTQKKNLVCDNPQEFLKSHIIKGDSSDGIPNILSDGDTFVNPEKRQKRLTKNVMNKIEQSLAEGSIPDDISENWERNERLVNLDFIPEEIENEILAEWEKPITGDRGKIFNYFMDNRLKVLMESIEEF